MQAIYALHAPATGGLAADSRQRSPAAAYAVGCRMKSWQKEVARMRLRGVPLLILLFAVFASLGSRPTAEEPSDLLNYIAEARESGLSESARSALLSIASIRTGSTQLKFMEGSAPGQYTRSYSSTACPVPGADPDKVAAYLEELRSKNEADLEALRRYADTDASGFVSSAEGADFRNLMELGLLADFILRQEDGSVKRIARAAMMKQQDVEERLEAYNRVALSLNASTPYKLPILRLQQSDHD